MRRERSQLLKTVNITETQHPRQAAELAPSTVRPIRLFDFRFGRVKLWADWGTDGLWWDSTAVGRRYDLLALTRVVAPDHVAIHGLVIWRLFVKWGRTPKRA